MFGSVKQHTSPSRAVIVDLPLLVPVGISEAGPTGRQAVAVAVSASRILGGFVCRKMQSRSVEPPDAKVT